MNEERAVVDFSASGGEGAEAIANAFREKLVFNGVNAVTGDYGVRPMSSEQLAQLLQGKLSPEDLQAFAAQQKQLDALSPMRDRERLQKLTEAQQQLQEQEEKVRLAELEFKSTFQQTIVSSPVRPGAGDPALVEEVGWAALFPADMHPTLREEIKEALQPLFDLRREQAGEKFRIYEKGQAYRPGERKDQFFHRQHISPGAADPEEMPFYVMLVGTPEEIPYKFQYQLDVMRGVGRLDFGDNVEAYAAYARNVVAATTGEVKLPRRAAFFGPSNPGDRATELSTRYLVRPLYEDLRVAAPENQLPLDYPWELPAPLIGEGQATWAQLKRLLGGDADQTPALLFTASHGVEFPAGDARQPHHQGALLCQDWGGPGADLRREHYFAGEDLASQANLLGMVAMFFACYGAGTPLLDQFAMQAFKVREKITPFGFTAALPQRLLQQGALAVIGHVERAWGYSFISPSGHVENQDFITALRMLMNGKPVGLATDPSFNLRYAGLSSDLSTVLEELRWDPDYMNEYELAHRWTANNDARGYVVVGDPAVSIPFARGDEETLERPDLGTLNAPEPPAPTEDTPPPLPASPEAGGEAPLDAPASLEASAAFPESGNFSPEMSTFYDEDIPFADEEPMAFGLSDQFATLRTSLQQFTNQLARSLSQAAEEMLTLEVRTYTTADLAAVSEALAQREKVDAQLRALTRVEFDGDMQIYVPEKPAGGVDQELWAIHRAMVEEAQVNRARFLQTMTELATHLLNSLKLL